jgi:hypothetical protein
MEPWRVLRLHVSVFDARLDARALTLCQQTGQSTRAIFFRCRAHRPIVARVVTDPFAPCCRVDAVRDHKLRCRDHPERRCCLGLRLFRFALCLQPWVLVRVDMLREMQLVPVSTPSLTTIPALVSRQPASGLELCNMPSDAFRGLVRLGCDGVDARERFIRPGGHDEVMQDLQDGALRRTGRTILRPNQPAPFPKLRCESVFSHGRHLRAGSTDRTLADDPTA